MDNRQQTTDNGRGGAGNMESRSHGITEICFATPDNKTTSQRDTSRAAATCSLVVSLSCSLLSGSEAFAVGGIRKYACFGVDEICNREGLFLTEDTFFVFCEKSCIFAKNIKHVY